VDTTATRGAQCVLNTLRAGILLGAFPTRREVYYLKMILPMTHVGAKSHREKLTCLLA
jgi:hypothetical protein